MQAMVGRFTSLQESEDGLKSKLQELQEISKQREVLLPLVRESISYVKKNYSNVLCDQNEEAKRLKKISAAKFIVKRNLEIDLKESQIYIALTMKHWFQKTKEHALFLCPKLDLDELGLFKVIYDGKFMEAVEYKEETEGFKEEVTPSQDN